mmetsp:Transcript_7138/g.9565  ORF Transcript_7138/g.9565 Transcript_7138/m.9565 type:complete len:107 (-) Transcript_7138:96-416(-)
MAEKNTKVAKVRKWNAIEMLSAPENRSVAQKLLLTTAIMFIFPISTYFFFHEIVLANHPSKSMWSGLMAVLATNIVMGCYCISAFYEDAPEAPSPPPTGFFAKKTD